MSALRLPTAAGGLLPAVAAGLITGLVVAILSLSFAVLIFSGPLAPWRAAAITMVLITAAVVGSTVALLSSYPGAVAFPQDKVAPILALLAAVTAAALPPETPAQELLATVVAALLAATLAAGTALFALGLFRLGALIRFFPYPVIGGFLAGTGWLLVLGSLKVMVGAPVSLAHPSSLFAAEAAARWLPGLGFALLLTFVTRRWRHVITLPLALLLAILLFHGVRIGLGVSPEGAEAAGFVLGRMGAGGGDAHFTLLDLGAARWEVVLAQAGTVATIVVISVIGVLLNSSGIEIAANEDMDLNRELKVAGVANLLSGLGGGVVGFHTLGLTSLVMRMGVRSRVVGLVSSLVCLGMLAAGPDLLAQFPKAVLGGLLMYLGLGFLIEWLYESRRRVGSADYAIMLLIVGIVGAFGYLHGAAAGLVASVVLFVVSYSRVEVARHELSGREVASNVDRPAEELRLLRAEGDRILAFTLQGYMFFGTAHRLLVQVVGRTTGSAVQYLVFDFRHVTGIDSSAAMSFAKLRQFARKRGLTLVFAHLSPAVRRVFAAAGFDGEGHTTFHIESDFDHALEWCENQLIRAIAPPAPPLPSLRAELAARLAPEVIESVLAHFETVSLPAGGVLMAEGAPSDELYLLESGRLTVTLAADDGSAVRLRSVRAGTVLGEMGVYLGEVRSATVICETDAQLLRLSAAALARLTAAEPAAAAAFHEWMARRLAQRLREADRMIKALLD